MWKNPNAKRITKRAVDALKCRRGKDRSILWDNALSGFGVVAHASGSKSYIVQYRFNGRSHRFAIGAHGRFTPEQARKEAQRVLSEMQSGREPIATREAKRKAELATRTFKQLAEEFMRLHVTQKRKESTGADYRGLLDRHVMPALGSTRMDNLKRVDVSRLHSRLSEWPYEANRCLALISAIWNWAAKREEVAFIDNPAKGIERYAEPKRECYLTNDELARLGDALREGETKGIAWETDRVSKKVKHIPKGDRRQRLDPYATAAIRLLVLTGARLREILDAKWEHVDFQRCVMLLPDSKTGRKTIYLSAPALTVLASVPRQQGNPYLIPGAKQGAPRADLKKPWSAIRRAANLKGVRIHDLRHSFASVGAGASLGLPIIGKLLGHSQPATTARYSHLDADPMQKAVNVIGARIESAMSGRPVDNVVPLARA
ncbi:MAG TPA: tyrosine-type recombinase/integrase [Rhizomicrobium sp.]|nr:tyrosine-type recombinase/integrase [Rhizomicrobium sp.]